MRIDEAIAILTLDRVCDFEGDRFALMEAHQLGIEALKRVENERTNFAAINDSLLPGETKE